MGENTKRSEDKMVTYIRKISEKTTSNEGVSRVPKSHGKTM